MSHSTDGTCQWPLEAAGGARPSPTSSTAASTSPSTSLSPCPSPRPMARFRSSEFEGQARRGPVGVAMRWRWVVTWSGVIAARDPRTLAIFHGAARQSDVIAVAPSKFGRLGSRSSQRCQRWLLSRSSVWAVLRFTRRATVRGDGCRARDPDFVST